VEKSKMDRSQKVVVLMLVLAIIFSVVSIVISYNFANFDLDFLKSRGVSGNVVDSSGGGIGLVVESPPQIGGEG
jgi:uncharacterized protein YprB with RNaseH-like and TPR domain